MSFTEEEIFETNNNLPHIYVNNEILKPIAVDFSQDDFEKQQIYNRVYEINGVTFREHISDDNGMLSAFEIQTTNTSDGEMEVKIRETADIYLPVSIQETPYGVIINSNALLLIDQWNTIVDDNGSHWCVVCDTAIGGVTDHVDSILHIQNLEKYRPLKIFDLSITRLIGDVYHCGVCNERFDRGEDDRHFDSKRHEESMLSATNRAFDVMYDFDVHDSCRNNDTAKSETVNKNAVDCYHFDRNRILSVSEASSGFDSANGFYDYDPDGDNNVMYLSDNETDYNDIDNNGIDNNGIEFDAEPNEYSDPNYISYASMAKVAAAPEYLYVTIFDKKMKMKFDHWHMLSAFKSGQLYCMVCQKYCQATQKAQHCAQKAHLDRLACYKFLDDYKSYFIRKVDYKYYHCGICNNLQVVSDLDEHIKSRHKKKFIKAVHSEVVPKKNKNNEKNTKNNGIDKTGTVPLNFKGPQNTTLTSQPVDTIKNTPIVIDSRDTNNGSKDKTDTDTKTGDATSTNYEELIRNYYKRHLTQNTELTGANVADTNTVIHTNNDEETAMPEANTDIGADKTVIEKDNDARTVTAAVNTDSVTSKTVMEKNNDATTIMPIASLMDNSANTINDCHDIGKNIESPNIDINSDILINQFGFSVRVPFLSYNFVSRIQSDYYCHLCDVTACDSVVAFHIKASGHVDKLRNIPFDNIYTIHLIRMHGSQNHCAICNAIFNADATKDHIVGSNHIKMLTNALSVNQPTNQAAIGMNQSTSGMNPAAMGMNQTTSGMNPAAMGMNQTTSGMNPAAMGMNQTTSGMNPAAMGMNQTTSGMNPAAMGMNQTTSGMNPAAMGMNQTTSGMNPAAMGINETTSGMNPAAMGMNQTTSGMNPAAMGMNQTTSGMNPAAMGMNQTTSGMNPAAMGMNQTTSGMNPAAMGMNQTTSGMNPAAMGMNQTTSGMNPAAIVMNPLPMNQTTSSMHPAAMHMNQLPMNQTTSGMNQTPMQPLLFPMFQRPPYIQTLPINQPAMPMNQWPALPPTKGIQYRPRPSGFNQSIKNQNQTTNLIKFKANTKQPTLHLTTIDLNKPTFKQEIISANQRKNSLPNLNVNKSIIDSNQVSMNRPANDENQQESKDFNQSKTDTNQRAIQLKQKRIYSNSESIIESNQAAMNQPANDENQQVSKDLNQSKTDTNQRATVQAKQKRIDSKFESVEDMLDLDESIDDVYDADHISEDCEYFEEKFVFLKLKNTYLKVGLLSYNSLIKIGDGTSYCFVCSMKIHGSLKKHVESKRHTNCMDQCKFLIKYDRHLLRQMFLNYHCSVCNTVFTRKDVNKHITWPMHLQDNKADKKTRRSNVKSGSKLLNVNFKNEDIYLNEKESEAKVLVQIVIRRDGQHVEDILQKKNKIIIFEDKVLKISWDAYHGLCKNRTSHRCVLCQRDVRAYELGSHIRSAHHLEMLDTFQTQNLPHLIRQIDESILNCVICNVEVANKEHIITDHVSGKRHRKLHDAILDHSRSVDSYADCADDVLHLCSA